MVFVGFYVYQKGYGEEALVVFIGFLKVGNERPDDYIL